MAKDAYRQALYEALGSDTEAPLLPSQEDPSFWRKVLQAPGVRHATGGLLYGVDILARPSYALGNLSRAMYTGDTNELADALRQFVPFGEWMERTFGVNLAPDRKEDLGMMLGSYLKEQGMNPYLAGAAGLAASWFTEPWRIIPASTIAKAGSYASRAATGTARAVRWTAKALEHQPYVGRIAGGGLKYYDIAKQGLKRAFIKEKRLLDIEALGRILKQETELPIDDAMQIIQDYITEGTGLRFMRNVKETLASKTVSVHTRSGVIEKSIPIHANMVGETGIGQYLSALGGANIARGKVAEGLARRITHFAHAPEAYVTVNNLRFIGSQARELFDDILGYIPQTIRNAGSLHIRETKRGIQIAGRLIDDVTDRSVAVIAPYISGTDDVARIADKLYRAGARSVEIITPLYEAQTHTLAKAIDYYARGGKAVRQAVRIASDKRMKGALQQGSKLPHTVLEAMSIAQETGKYPAWLTGTQRRIAVRLNRVLGSIDKYAAKIEGVSLTDPILKGYKMHAWGEDFTKWFSGLDAKTKYSILRNAMKKFFNQPDDVIEKLKAYAKEYRGPGWEKRLGHVHRIREKLPEVSVGGDDLTRFMVDGFRELMDDPELAQLMDMIPNGADQALDLLYSIHTGQTTSGIARHVWNMGRDVGRLDKDWLAAIREAGVPLPATIMSVWEKNALKLTAKRLHKAAMFKAAEGLKRGAAKYAAKTIPVDELDEIFPILKKSARSLDDVAEMSQVIEYRLGGKVGVFKSGPYRGHYIFREIDDVMHEVAMKSPKALKDVAKKYHVFDPDTGRMLEDLFRLQSSKAYAAAKANTIKGGVMAAAEWFTNEMRGGMLLNSLRWPVRNFIDDTLRGWFEYGNDYIVKLKEYLHPQFSAKSIHGHPERIRVWGRVVSWDEMYKLGEAQGDIFMGFGSQVRTGARYRASLDVAEQALVEQGKPIKSVWQKMAEAVGVDIKGRQIVGAHPLSRNALAKKIQALNDTFEDKRRMAAWVSGIEDGFRKAGIQQGAWTMDDVLRASPEAVRRLDKSIYIYSNITPWEKEYASKIMMFYPFYRKNLPYWFNKAVEKPAHMLMLNRFFEYMGEEETEFEKRYKAPFLKNMYHFKTGQDELGRTTYAYGFGLSVEDINRFVALGQGFKGPVYKFLGSLNPILRMPAEYITGKNFFFDNHIEDWNRAYEVMDHIPGLKEFLRVREERTPDGSLRWKADGRRLWWLSNLGKPIMDVMPVMDSLYGESGWAKGKGKRKLATALTGWLTGMNVHHSDPQMWANIIERRELAQALDEQRKRGALKKMTSWYLPKGYQGNPEEQEFMERMLREYGQITRQRARLK